MTAVTATVALAFASVGVLAPNAWATERGLTPTASNITNALDQISRRVKPGDTLYLLYSGHGIDIDGKSYLVPWDADARTASSLLRTVLPTWRK